MTWLTRLAEESPLLASFAFLVMLRGRTRVNAPSKRVLRHLAMHIVDVLHALEINKWRETERSACVFVCVVCVCVCVCVCLCFCICACVQESECK